MGFSLLLLEWSEGKNIIITIIIIIIIIIRVIFYFKFYPLASYKFILFYFIFKKLDRYF